MPVCPASPLNADVAIHLQKLLQNVRSVPKDMVLTRQHFVRIRKRVSFLLQLLNQLFAYATHFIGLCAGQQLYPGLRPGKRASESVCYCGVRRNIFNEQLLGLHNPVLVSYVSEGGVILGVRSYDRGLEQVLVYWTDRWALVVLLVKETERWFFQVFVTSCSVPISKAGPGC